jgi:hypothetical protein
MYGMEISVNVNKIVLVEEYTIHNIKFVFVLMVKHGMELHVLTSNHVAVENNGMIQVYNVIVQLVLTGMVELAFFVQMEKFGILQQDHVFVKLVLNGMDNSVL